MQLGIPSSYGLIHGPRSYLLTAVLTLLALYVRVLIAPFFGSYVPYPTVWAAIAFSAWCCGLGPSLLSIVMSVIGIWFWFPGLPRNFAQENGLPGLVTFIVFALLIVLLGHSNRRSLERRNAAEREALRSRTLFDAFMENSPAVAYVKDREGRLVYLNRTARSRFGIMDVEGEADAKSIPAEDSALSQKHDENVLREEKPMEFIEYTKEPDGRHAWLTAKFPVREPDGGNVLLGVKAFDVTDRVNAEQALVEAHRELEKRVQERTAELIEANQSLRDLSARLLQVRDEEHRRMARELHDSVGQLLAALSMNISLMSRDLGKVTPEVNRAIIESKDLIDQASREIRTISHLLHPPLLDEMGLSSALQWYVDGFAGRSGVKVNLEIAPSIERLPADVEVAMFRLVQECLTNIHRHSGSSTADIRLLQKDSWFCVEVQDAGKGIPAEKRPELNGNGQAGVGIRGMRERIRILGGELQIESSPAGTTVRASLPARQPGKSAAKADPPESPSSAA